MLPVANAFARAAADRQRSFASWLASEDDDDFAERRTRAAAAAAAATAATATAAAAPPQVLRASTPTRSGDAAWGRRTRAGVLLRDASSSALRRSVSAGSAGSPHTQRREPRRLPQHLLHEQLVTRRRRLHHPLVAAAAPHRSPRQDAIAKRTASMSSMKRSASRRQGRTLATTTTTPPRRMHSPRRERKVRPTSSSSSNSFSSAAASRRRRGRALATTATTPPSPLPERNMRRAAAPPSPLSPASIALPLRRRSVPVPSCPAPAKKQLLATSAAAAAPASPATMPPLDSIKRAVVSHARARRDEVKLHISRRGTITIVDEEETSSSAISVINPLPPTGIMGAPSPRWMRFRRKSHEEKRVVKEKKKKKKKKKTRGTPVPRSQPSGNFTTPSPSKPQPSQPQLLLLSRDEKERRHALIVAVATEIRSARENSKENVRLLARARLELATLKREAKVEQAAHVEMEDARRQQREAAARAATVRAAVAATVVAAAAAAASVGASTSAAGVADASAALIALHAVKLAQAREAALRELVATMQQQQQQQQQQRAVGQQQRAKSTKSTELRAEGERADVRNADAAAAPAEVHVDAHANLDHLRPRTTVPRAQQAAEAPQTVLRAAEAPQAPLVLAPQEGGAAQGAAAQRSAPHRAFAALRGKQRRQPRASIVHPRGAAMAGGLLKRGKNLWQKRHFVLSGHYLMYKVDDAEAQSFAGGADLTSVGSSVTLTREGTLEVVGLSSDAHDAGRDGERAMRSLVLKQLPKSSGGDSYPSLAEWLAALTAVQRMSVPTEKAAPAAPAAEARASIAFTLSSRLDRRVVVETTNWTPPSLSHDSLEEEDLEEEEEGEGREPTLRIGRVYWSTKENQRFESVASIGRQTVFAK